EYYECNHLDSYSDVPEGYILYKRFCKQNNYDNMVNEIFNLSGKNLYEYIEKNKLSFVYAIDPDIVLDLIKNGLMMNIIKYLSKHLQTFKDCGLYNKNNEIINLIYDLYDEKHWIKFIDSYVMTTEDYISDEIIYKIICMTPYSILQ